MHKSLVLTMAAFAAIGLLVSPIAANAEAGGTVKGAVVGGVAGHMMGGHTKTGAAVGAVAGHHERAKAEAKDTPKP